MAKKRSKAVTAALEHKNKLGEGAKKRKKLTQSQNAEALAIEFKRGKLHSGSGKIVKNKKQLKAIIANTNKGRKK